MQVIEAIVLYEAFQKNKKEAKSEYIGKNVIITGVAVYVGPDMFGLPSVELSDRKDGMTYVLCVIPAAEQYKVRKGDNVTISGECHVFDYGFVTVKKCKVMM